MNRDVLVEQSVSDAITAKPIRFSVKYKERKSVDVEITEKVPLCRFLPFLRKEVVRTDTEFREVEVEREFEIYPPALGKMQILSKLYLEMEFDEEVLQTEPYKEAMRVCASHTDTVAKLMAVSVCRTEEDLLNDKEIAEKAKFFKWHCMPGDFANCLLAMLTQVDYENFIVSMRLMQIVRQNKPTKQGADRIE